MRTKNFFKGLAVAAVALVGVFATSCSEEELNLNGTINGTPVDPVTPTELPDGVAYAAISVVDLGDLGLGSKVLYTETKVVTGLDGTEIECPDFDGMEEYVIPAAQTISVPTLSKGQTVTIPMTFYVVKTTSAFAKVNWNYDDPKDWGYTEEGMPYVYSEETWKGTEEEDLQNWSNYWKDVQVEYNIPLAYFVSVLGETEAPEAGEGEGEGTEGEEGEGTEGEEGEGTEGEEGEGTEGEEGEGTEGEEGEGEGDATEGTELLALDFEDGQKYFNSWDNGNGDGTLVVEEGALKISNTPDTNPWDFQMCFEVTEPFALQDYVISMKVKGSVETSIPVGFQIVDGYQPAGDFEALTVTTEWTEVEIKGTCNAEGATRILWTLGTLDGDVYMDDIKIVAVAPAAKAAATTADEIVAAFVKNIVMPEYGVEGESWSMTTPSVRLYSGGCVDFTKTIYSNHPTYVFEYLGEEVEVTFEQIIYASGMLGTPYAIPGHESEYSHSEGHGHYQHDQHGNDMNAGGGIVSFE